MKPIAAALVALLAGCGVAGGDASTVEVLKSTWRKNPDVIDSLSPKYIVAVQVKNIGDQAISGVSLHGVLKSAGRDVPWCEIDFDQAVAGGLEPGETKEFEVRSHPLAAEWDGADNAPADAVFTTTVRKVESPSD